MARAVSGSGVPPAWVSLSTHIVLWHGCLRSSAQHIQANGIMLAQSRNDLDFGKGFYTTTIRTQAERWAHVKHSWLSATARATDRPAILQFRVPLGTLAQLDSLMFVSGASDQDAFWSFVQHCRNNSQTAPRRHLNPNRTAPDDWYDVVCGPLAISWPPKGRLASPSSDQFSFHTDTTATILNNVIAAGAPDFQLVVL